MLSHVCHQFPGDPQKNSKNAIWWRSFHYQPFSRLDVLPLACQAVSTSRGGGEDSVGLTITRCGFVQGGYALEIPHESKTCCCPWQYGVRKFQKVQKACPELQVQWPYGNEQYWNGYLFMYAENVRLKSCPCLLLLIYYSLRKREREREDISVFKYTIKVCTIMLYYSTVAAQTNVADARVHWRGSRHCQFRNTKSMKRP